MRLKFIGIMLCALCTVLSAIDLREKLPVDPTIQQYTLPNGLKVLVKENKTPPGKVDIYLHIGSGSLDEEDNQQGLAHFLEHMAFNGSKNFPAGSLVQYFESMGMTFGMHQNAFTSFDQTTYILSLPNVEMTTVDKGLLCMSDFAFRLDLPEVEINKERGVIVEEERARSSVQQRIMNKIFPDLLPGSRVAQRMPIGKTEIIKNSPRERFVEFYEKWYHPENATVIIVGDIKAVDMQRMVTKHFGEWKKKDKVPEPLPSGITPYSETRAVVVTDPELTSTEVSLVSIMPPRPEKTVGNYRENLVAAIGDWIMNRRLSEIIKEGKGEFQSAQVGQSDFLNVSTYVSASAEGESEKWQKMLTQLVVELKRAREHGFHEQEMDDAIKTIFADAERSVATAATRNSKSIIGEINSSIADEVLPMSAQQEFDLLSKLMPGITITEINEFFSRVYRDQSRLILIQMPDKVGLEIPALDAVLKVVRDAEREEVTPLVFKERPKHLLEKEPVPGTIVSETLHEGTKVSSVKFANGVKFHHRYMDFSKDSIQVVVSFMGGKIEETAENVGISDMAVIPLRSPSTNKLSSVDIEGMMTGKNVHVSGRADKDRITLTITGNKKDLEDGFRLAHALVTSAKIESSIFNLVKQQLIQAIAQYDSSVDMQLMDNMGKAISHNDIRFSMLTLKQIDALQVEQAQNWLERILRTAPIEACVVGDINFEDSKQLMNKYFGSLKNRESFEHLSALRELSSKPMLVDQEIKVNTQTPKSLVLLGWRGPNYEEVKERHCMILAAKILSSRLHEEIREKQQLTYSAFAQAKISPEYQNSGLLFAYFTADKTKARNAADLCAELVYKFAKDGPTQAETETVLKQMQTDLKASLEQPSFWSSYLADLELYKKNLDELAKIESIYQSYTREDIHQVLRKYISKTNNVRLVAIPK